MARSERQKLLARRLAIKGPQAPADDDFRDRRPKLFELLTSTLTVAERVMDPVRLTLSIGDADWVLGISDSVLCQSLSIRAGTLQEGLDRLESILGTEAAKWMPWRGRAPRLPGGHAKKKARKVDDPNGVE